MEDPNELFCDLRDHCDLDEVKLAGGLCWLNERKATSHAACLEQSASDHPDGPTALASESSTKRQKLDPMAFVGKYQEMKPHYKTIESMHISSVSDNHVGASRTSV